MNTNQEQPLYEVKTEEFINLVRSRLKITKQKFLLEEAILRAEHNHLNDLVQDYKPFIDTYKHLSTKPLKENQFYNYSTYYQETGVKLDEEYFNYDLDALATEYRKIKKTKAEAKAKGEEAPKRYSIKKYENYVTFMALKLSPYYDLDKDNYDTIFRIKQGKEGDTKEQAKTRRQYNPLATIPTPLRPELPFEVKEYDIVRSFPTFIDIELGIKKREVDVYSLIDKRSFNMLLNMHSGIKGASIEAVRKELSVVYGDKVKDVITEERFNNKGLFASQYEVFETEYINKFIEANVKDIPHARLHDGVFVRQDVDDSKFTLQFGDVKFAKKEAIRPKKLRHKKPFYSFDEKGKVYTDSYNYLEFLKNERFAVLDDDERNKMLYFKNDNRLIKPYNEKRFGELLNSKIIHHDKQEIVNSIAKDISGYTFKGALGQLPFVDNNYYKDSENMFCILFKNGLFAQTIDDNNNMVVKQISVDEVEGNWQEHRVLSNHNFKYTEEVGIFERFVQLIVTRKDFEQDENGKWHNDNLTEEEKKLMLSWQSMIGYSATSFRTPTDTAMIILTDENPTPNERKGRRGKSLIQEAIKQLNHSMDLNAVSWNAKGLFSWNGYKHHQKLVTLDDLPAAFDYDSMFSILTNGIKGELKNGGYFKVAIEDMPVFMGTTNFAIPELKGSYKSRFVEFKVTDFFSSEYTPYDYFGQKFFDNNWSEDESNRFYSWIFRCLYTYMVNGLVRPDYDKVKDTFITNFSNEEKLKEWERILNIVVKGGNGSFTASDIYGLYDDIKNPLRRLGWIHQNNTKRCLYAYCNYYGYTLVNFSNNMYRIPNFEAVTKQRENEMKIKLQDEEYTYKEKYGTYQTSIIDDSLPF